MRISVTNNDKCLVDEEKLNDNQLSKASQKFKSASMPTTPWRCGERTTAIKFSWLTGQW